jgi:hypothetical protein
MWTEEDAAWSPPAGAGTHAGGAIGPEMDFFIPPPEEIGAVVSAHSTLRRDQRPLSPSARTAVVFLPGFAAMVALPYVGVTDAAWQVGAFLALVALLGYLTRFAHACTYVGKEGIARCRCRGGRTRRVRQEVFPFRDATELRTEETRQYHHGIYTGTSYHFTWTDDAGRKVFKLAGQYRAGKKPPKPADPYHFARAAEASWSVYLLDHAQQQLVRFGAIQFRLGGADRVDVGPGFIDLHLKGRSERCAAQEIGAISISQGVFKVKRADAKEGWFSSRGVFQFPYGTMANARVFLLVCDRLLGVRFD